MCIEIAFLVEDAQSDFFAALCALQGSGNSEIWIDPAIDDDVINEPISKKNHNITCHEN